MSCPKVGGERCKQTCGHCRTCGQPLDNHNSLALTPEGRAKTTCPKAKPA